MASMSFTEVKAKLMLSNSELDSNLCKENQRSYFWLAVTTILYPKTFQRMHLLFILEVSEIKVLSMLTLFCQPQLTQNEVELMVQNL